MHESTNSIANRIPKCPQCGYSWQSLAEEGRCPECKTRFDCDSNRWPLVLLPASIFQRITTMLAFIAALAITPYLYPFGSVLETLAYSFVQFILAATIWHDFRIRRKAIRGRYIRKGWVYVLPHVLLIKMEGIITQPQIHSIGKITGVRVVGTSSGSKMSYRQLCVRTSALTAPAIFLNFPDEATARAIADTLQVHLNPDPSRDAEPVA